MITIVAGMHRSGTSLMAGLLHFNRVIMGRHHEFSPPPMKENPKGFFENRRFRVINDFILRHNGYQVKSFNTEIPTDPQLPAGALCEMVCLLKEYDLCYENWGWKDPRTTLTFGCWFLALKEAGLLNKVRVIVMLRNRDDIRMSMLRRGNKENQEGQFVDLSGLYMAAGIKALWEHNINFRLVPFEALIGERPEDALSLVEEMLGVKLTDLSHLDRSIPKSVGSVADEQED